MVTTLSPLLDETLTSPDEGWWQSILADESRFLAPSTPEAAPALAQERLQSPADWEYALRLFRQDQILSLKAVGYNRGGLLVENERLHGFVPYSHLTEMTCEVEAERESFLARYVGQELKAKIIECAPQEGRVVFSERAARADAGRRTELFNSLQPGQLVSGLVTNVTDFGVFIDLGGVEGLIHISELSWGRVLHPSHILQVGQTTRVQVLELLPERCRIALSLKRLQPNPWLTAPQRYSVGDVLPATVTSVVSFGVFARLEDGLEGLVHASEIDLPAGATIRERFSSDQRISVRVLHLDPAQQRLGLSLKLNS